MIKKPGRTLISTRLPKMHDLFAQTLQNEIILAEVSSSRNILWFTFQNGYKQTVDAEDILPIDGAELYLDVADWYTEREQYDVMSQKVRHYKENVTQR